MDLMLPTSDSLVRPTRSLKMATRNSRP